MTTLSALARPRILLAPGPNRRGFVLGFLATVVVGLMMLIGASTGVALSHSDRVMPGVSVAGVPLDGLDRQAAIEHLESQLPSLAAGSLRLSVDGVFVDTPYAELGAGYDLEATVDAAFAVARSGNPLGDALSRLRAVVNPTSIGAPIMAYEEAAIDDLVSSIGQRFDRAPVDAAVSLQAKTRFRVTPAVEGRLVDRAALNAAISAALTDQTALKPTIDVTFMRQAPAISTANASAAAAAAFRMSSTPLKLTGTAKSLGLDRAALAGVISLEVAGEGGYRASVDVNAVRKLLRPLAERIARAPRDASFIYGPSGVVGVVAGEAGRTLKVRATAANIVAALEQRAAGAPKLRAALAIGVARPNVTTAEARQVAPVMRPLSSWTTYYVPSEGNFWNANIHIPAWDLDGKVIAPGEWFEFWQGIGPVTLERGYGYGGAIIGGRSVPNGALAGGICSTSTTLFNAAMRAGLEIGERTNHSYYIERYPMGLDATVLQTDTWETDMTFRNDTDHPIVIRSYTGNGFVRFDIWGVPTGRTVSLSAPITSNHGTAIETTVFNPDLAPGTSKRVEYMHNGFDAVVTRWVRDADGNLIHEDTWYSHYRTVNGITEVGPKRTSD